MDGNGQHIAAFPENTLRAIAVMDIEISDCHARQPMHSLGMARSNGCIGE
jgi:hypothetical protein